MHSAGEAVKDVVNNTVTLDMNDIEFMDQTMQLDGSELVELCDQNAPRDGTMELTEANLKPVNKGTMIYDPSKARRQSSVFRPVSNGVEAYPTFEQARIFLERYPVFNSIESDNLRVEFLYSLEGQYNKVVAENKANQVSMSWEDSFEKALDAVQARLERNVRNGNGVSGVSEIEPEGEVRTSTPELDVTDSFLEGKMSGWDDGLKEEFRKIWSSWKGPDGDLETRDILEYRFDAAVRGWLEYKRGMPADVIDSIVSLDIPVEDVPRHVDNAVYRHGILPSGIVNFLERNAAGRSIDQLDVDPNSAELMLDVDTYINESLERLREGGVTEIELRVIEKAFDARMASTTLELVGGEPAATAGELKAAFNSAIGTWRAAFTYVNAKIDKLGVRAEISDKAMAGIKEAYFVSLVSEHINSDGFVSEGGFRGAYETAVGSWLEGRLLKMQEEYETKLNEWQQHKIGSEPKSKIDNWKPRELAKEMMEGARNYRGGFEAAIGIFTTATDRKFGDSRAVWNALNHVDGLQRLDARGGAEAGVAAEGVGEKTRVVNMDALARGERSVIREENSPTRVFDMSELAQRSAMDVYEPTRQYLEPSAPSSSDIEWQGKVLKFNNFTAEPAWVDALVADGFTRANAIQAINSVAVACFDRNLEGGEVRLVIDNAVNRPELIEEFRGSFYPEDMGLIADRAVDAVLPHRSGVIELRPTTLGDGVGRGVETGVTDTRATDGTFASAGRVTEGGRKARVEREGDGSRKLSDAERLATEGAKAGKVVEGARRH